MADLDQDQKLKALSALFQQSQAQKTADDTVNSALTMDPETKAAISGTVDDAKDAASSGFNAVKNAVAPAASSAGGLVGQIAGSAGDALGYLGDQAKQAAQSVGNSINQAAVNNAVSNSKLNNPAISGMSDAQLDDYIAKKKQGQQQQQAQALAALQAIQNR